MLKKVALVWLLVFATACSKQGTATQTPSANEGASPAAVTDPQPQSAANEAPSTESWDDVIAGHQRMDGFLPLFVNAKAGSLHAAFPTPDETGLSLRAIHAAGLTAGLGSNPIGLDRGLFDSGSIIAFRRVGNRLIAQQENWTYRASAENPLEKRAVRESFAPSFIWSGDIIAESDAGELLVDFSSFVTRDALGVRQALENHPRGGTFSIAAERTMPDFENVLVFPDNIELDGFMTLVSEKPKSEVVATAADGRAVTLVQHHSLVRLPDDDYTPREFDPRSGTIDVPYYDFSAPLSGQVKNAFARRFRLMKEDAGNPDSATKNPIVFYVDSGAPEEIRNALIEGASWWADAFAEAGFPDGYRVEVLPEDAHPRDIRFNTILWTHRRTRGWSYGGGVSDPRTGEMIKANVILGSQRVRQDRMIFEGLAGAAKTGSGDADDPVEIALARIRQLSAHEVGHTLGFAHNFAASSNDRASVMDYPAPLVTIDGEGNFDFTRAYDVGIGEWDKVAARWLYSDVADGDEGQAALDSILTNAYASGLRFIGDREARSVGTAHPFASVWDNGPDAIIALNQAMDVRKAALNKFSTASIGDGEPIARLREVIVPIYLYHRYQLSAASKYLGGYEFSYKAKGDNLADGAIVPDADQRRALYAIADTLNPSVLTLSDDLVNQLSPTLGSFSGGGGAETFDASTGPVFDLLYAADSAGSLAMNALLHPDRAARLVDFKSRDPSRLGLSDVLARIEQAIFVSGETPRETAIAKRLQSRFLSNLMTLSAGAGAIGEAQAAAIGLSNGGGEIATPEVRAIVDAYLRGLRTRIAPGLLSGQSPDRQHREWMVELIDRHLDRPAPPTYGVAAPADIPPGSPIGSPGYETCWHCDPPPALKDIK